MAKRSGLGMAMYVAGYDISGDVGSISKIACPRALYDVTGINKSAAERVLGHADGAIDFAGFLNNAASQEHAILSTLPTTDVLELVLFSQILGDPCVALTAKEADYAYTRPAAGSIGWNVQSQGDDVPLEWGVALTAGKVTAASSGAGTTKDDAAATSNGLAAFLQYFGRASGTATFIIEHSSDGSSWSTLLTFALSGGATVGAERKTSPTATQVKRYLRASTTGSFTNAVFAVGYRRGTPQDDTAY